MESDKSSEKVSGDFRGVDAELTALEQIIENVNSVQYKVTSAS